MKSLTAFIRLAALSAFFVTSFFLQTGCGAQSSASVKASPQASSEKKTLVEELLELESQYIDIPAESFDLLQAILKEGVEALGENAVEPLTPQEAILASKAVSQVLARHNFYQPMSDEVAPSTIGEALTPVSLSEDELSSLLKFDANAVRARDYDPGQPIYLVDCDMGSLLMMGVFERMGWDTRLVRAPIHMFLRWHLQDGATVNWDWSNLGSFEDDLYLLARKTTAREQVRQRTYLSSLSVDEARGNFIGLIGSSTYNTEDAVLLLRQAIELAPNNPTNLNNLALIYSTDPELVQDYSEVAIMYAHRAVAADLLRVNRLGTLACAYAADGQWELATAIYSGAADDIQLIQPDASTYIFDRIKQKKLCEE